MKKLLSIVLGILLVGGSTFAAQKRVRDANPFHVFQAVKVTSNGALSGDCFFQAQNGVVSDCQGNNFLTGVNLSGYLGNYIPRTETGTYYQIMPSTQIQDAGANYMMQGTDISISALGGEFRTLGIGLSISIDSGYGAIMDNRTSPRGIEYWNDYSAGFTDYSLVHKKYVVENYMSIADSGNYVPYSGATQDIYLANNNLIFDMGAMGGIIFSQSGSTFDGSTIMSFANNQLAFAGPDYGVNFDMSLLNTDITAYFPTQSGTFLFDTTLSGYLTGYVPRANIDTGFNNTGSDTIIPSEKAVYEYVNNITSIGWSTSGNIGTTGMVFGMTNDYRLQFIMSGQNAGYIDSIGGNRNTFYGALAGDDASTAQNNVGIGFGALTNSSAGNRNACVGYLCLNQNTNGTDNSCVGVHCMQSNNGGSYNSSVGDESLQNNIDGDFNTAIGMSAGNELTGGDKNTFIGNGADITGGNVSFSTAIGYNAKVRTSHMMQLGDTTLTRLTTRAKFGIGVVDPQYEIDVAGTIQSTSGYIVNNGVDMPFRFAYSGGLMEGQYYTGGVWVSAVQYTLP